MLLWMVNASATRRGIKTYSCGGWPIEQSPLLHGPTRARLRPVVQTLHTKGSGISTACATGKISRALERPSQWTMGWQANGDGQLGGRKPITIPKEPLARWAAGSLNGHITRAPTFRLPMPSKPPTPSGPEVLHGEIESLETRWQGKSYPWPGRRSSAARQCSATWGCS